MPKPLEIMLEPLLEAAKKADAATARADPPCAE